ncbi:hypothetical protein [Streptomyces sp. SGAir0957]
MIRLVTASRLERLASDARAAYEHARQTNGAANEAFARHARELHAATDRAVRAEADSLKLVEFLARAVVELAIAQEDLLLRDIEIRRLREELDAAGPSEGDSLTVLLHYGEPHTIYRSREEAQADTATHGIPPDAVWVPAGERSAYESRWRLEAFIYDAACNGFRRAFLLAQERVGGAA